MLLSTRFNRSYNKQAVPIEVVNSVVDYLKTFKKQCDTECACYRDKNCNCVCNSNSTCNCNCNCACECGNDTECQCDCQPYDCNCEIVKNCNYGSTRPMTQNCECQCPCFCECYCEPVDGVGGSTGEPGGNIIHTHFECYPCCPPPAAGWHLEGYSNLRGWLKQCRYKQKFIYGSDVLEFNNCPSAWWCCGKN